VDAHQNNGQWPKDLVDCRYTLGEQLFVDPHPLASPARLDLDERINMSPQEMAVACSHINAWKNIASGQYEYALVLEDDVWFHPRFARVVDQAWAELPAADRQTHLFDLLYVSYTEVDYGAEKVRVSPSLFVPFRGLWNLSGYVLSKSGAQRLLRRLPVRGPVDLWMNHQLANLKVYATMRSVIGQRRDERSTNFYSALPTLSRAGVLNSETPGLFRGRPTLAPIFAFGTPQSGLSSLAMALSMLGYRCCSDIDRLPRTEMQRLMQRDSSRVFDAYVNVTNLMDNVDQLASLYPDGRLILTIEGSEIVKPLDALLSTTGDRLDECAQAWGARTLMLPSDAPRMWKLVCEFLRCVPPPSSYPYREDEGQRLLHETADDEGSDTKDLVHIRKLRCDDAPWVATPRARWSGVPTAEKPEPTPEIKSIQFFDDFRRTNSSLWKLRDDTFTGNLALFRPSNFITSNSAPAQIVLRQEDLGVRKYSSAALSSRASFLYGRFEAVLRPSRALGLVTGVFLHRDSPRQEIDIEFVGKFPRQILTNVYYNPGNDGARFDYGYRGAPILVDLGFDATKDFHAYAIEWSPNELRWYADGRLIHRRANWDPTPIPHLPMQFHLNLWPSRSRELAGRIRRRNLPASCELVSVRLSPASVV
jgi:GR25 family glycosyltransferase involved in LPS biosynthesis